MKVFNIIFMYTLLLAQTIETSVAESFQSDIIPSEAGTIAPTNSTEGFGLLDKLFDFAKDSIFGILGLVAVGMFLYVGYNLLTAQGDSEKLKAAFQTLIHIIVGMFIVAIAWALIKLATGITL